MKTLNQRNIKFPKGFLFGSSTAAHQIEGGDNNCDWTHWEKKPDKIVDNSSAQIAADSWNNWKEDIELLKHTNQNAYRFSIDWSRIEPEKGKIDHKAIDHYRQILLTLKKENIKSMVTLFHFVLPSWASDQNGFLNNKIIEDYVKYVELVGEKLGDLVDLWVTINEPQTYALWGYVKGIWCPGRKNIFLFFKIARNLNRAHLLAYKRLRQIVSTPVGIVENIALFEPLYDNFVDKLFTTVVNYLATFFFIAPVSKYIDFLGINYYFKVHVQHKKPRFHFLAKRKSDTGWSINQEGLLKVIEKNLLWRKPIYITENGLADERDFYRPKFIQDGLFYTHKAIKKGADVRGYFYWTLMDNFEWTLGYTQKFGLFSIDRKPRPSAKIYADLIKKYSSD